MKAEEVIAKLRSHETELRQAGLLHVRLFGSVARGEADEASDVDLLADFDEGKRLSLIDVIGLENRLSDLLGVKVDLIQEGTLKERLRERADRAVVAF
jgi:predicted nucleotidyltransferase